MARSVPWKRAASDTTSWRQDQALNSTAFIVSQVGPMGFAVKMDGENKAFKVMLGDPHSCTCPGFHKDRNDLCKHICWVLLKRFKISREDPISWQMGMVEREINSLLLVEQNRRQVINNRPQSPRKAVTAAQDKDGRTVLEQREITEEDSCPICMEDLLVKRQPVTYCRYSCANSIHIKCMKVWADHQTKSGEKTVRCPFCREDFGSIEHLQQEYKNTATASLNRHNTAEHPGTTCKICHQHPIEGKCYRCTQCRDVTLCQRCFNTDTHTHHLFEFRALPTARWRPAERIVSNGLPVAPAVLNGMANRDIVDSDYDLLLQLDDHNRTELSNMPETAISKLPIERIRLGSRDLAHGVQCCVCLRAYHLGDHLRRLPCRHKFHRGCVDNWLLHQHPTCPACGRLVWGEQDVETAEVRTRVSRPRRRVVAEPPSSSTTTPALEVPGVGIRREIRSANSEATNTNPIRRVPRTGSTLSESAVIDSTNGRDARTDNTVSLAQLLLTDAIAANGGQQDTGNEDYGYILSQISNSAPTDDSDPQLGHHLDIFGVVDRNSRISAHNNQNDVRERQNRTLGTSNGSNETHNGATGVQNGSARIHGNVAGRKIDTDAENRKRRARNLALAAKGRAARDNNKETNSTPSISTLQPVGASNLYLGNPGSNQRFSEQPQGTLRGPLQRSARNMRYQGQSLLTDTGNLSIGAASGFSLDNRPKVCRPKNPTRARLQPVQVLNGIPLELNGTALDG